MGFGVLPAGHRISYAFADDCNDDHEKAKMRRKRLTPSEASATCYRLTVEIRRRINSGLSKFIRDVHY